MRSWCQHIREEEAAHFGACFEAAAKEGLTPLQAEDCDDGDKNCKDCPWKSDLPNHKEHPWRK